VPRIVRRAGVVWEGSLARGQGRVSAASSGAFDQLAVSLASRIGAPEGKTSPEELLAAAHAVCFAASLAGELGGLGHPPERLEVNCTIVMDEIPGQGHQIVGSEIGVVATVPGADADTMAQAARLADDGCPFSALLKRGGAHVEVDTSLAAGEG
jgi:osmotically inducible protein OsmC